MFVYEIYLVPKLRYPSSRENKSKPTAYLFSLFNVYILASSTLPLLVGLCKYVPWLRGGGGTHLCSAQPHGWAHLVLGAASCATQPSQGQSHHLCGTPPAMFVPLPCQGCYVLWG